MVGNQVGDGESSLQRTDLDGGGEHVQAGQPHPESQGDSDSSVEGSGLGEESRGSYVSQVLDQNQTPRLLQLQTPEPPSKLAQPERTFWVTELKGPGVGFRISWIQGFKYSQLGLAQLCLPALAGLLRQGGPFWWQRSPLAVAACIPPSLPPWCLRDPRMRATVRIERMGKGEVGAAVVISDLRGRVLG